MENILGGSKKSVSENDKYEYGHGKRYVILRLVRYAT
jgi:hypothetical protein